MSQLEPKGSEPTAAAVMFAAGSRDPWGSQAGSGGNVASQLTNPEDVARVAVVRSHPGPDSSRLGNLGGVSGHTVIGSGGTSFGIELPTAQVGSDDLSGGGSNASKGAVNALAPGVTD